MAYYGTSRDEKAKVDEEDDVLERAFDHYNGYLKNCADEAGDNEINHDDQGQEHTDHSDDTLEESCSQGHLKKITAAD